MGVNQNHTCQTIFWMGFVILKFTIWQGHDVFQFKTTEGFFKSVQHAHGSIERFTLYVQRLSLLPRSVGGGNSYKPSFYSTQKK